jgi:hypothetical protein
MMWLYFAVGIAADVPACKHAGTYFFEVTGKVQSSIHHHRRAQRRNYLAFGITAKVGLSAIVPA